MHKIVFYVPVNQAEEVKEALFEKGAGRYDKYECCAWQVAGRGQFKPLEGSNPFIGKKDQIEYVDEFRVEMICEDKLLKEVLTRLVEVHPYEEPAYEAYKIITLDDL